MQLHWRTRYPGPRHFSPERKRALEYLDRSDVDPTEKVRSYQDLDTISLLPAQFGPLQRALGRLAGRPLEKGRESLTLLELGAGSGRVGLRVARLLAGQGFRVELISTDLHPQNLPTAGQRGNVTVRPQQLDALHDALPTADLCFANLLIHHFHREEALGLLLRMRIAARLGGAVFDLDRNPWAFHFLRLFFPLWVRSPITVADALTSVQQAFRLDELEDMALAAGIEKPHIERFWMLRSLLWWERDGEQRVVNEEG